MKDPAGRHEPRRAVNARKRMSRRPSRLGTPAGSTAKPDRVREPDAGFPGLLKRVWRRAAEAADLPSSLDVLLTLDGHVPGDVQLRALDCAQQAALTALCGLTWHDPDPADGPAAEAAATRAEEPADRAPGPSGAPAFLGEIGLAANGRIAVRIPGGRPLDPRDLIGGVRRVPWTPTALAAYRQELARTAERLARSAADCRAWLAAQGPGGRDALLAQAGEAALRTAPFVLYQEDKQYTNFRDHNTLTGKTLWPGHPDCALNALRQLPLDLWSDHDTQLVVCLTLLIRSGGFGRIEEANGTQLTVDHVAHTLERVRRGYNAVPGGEPVPAAASRRVADLHDLATALHERRRAVGRSTQLYREIHGALMHKAERVAAAPGAAARARQDAVVERLRTKLPPAGATLAELGRAVAAAPGWLAEPHGAFGTGLESLVHETVAATAEAFDADFAMSRGMRSLPALVRALRARDWAEICDWDITHFFCCVVPLPRAADHFGGSPAALADAAWAMSSRMQYNSWHFVAGNLPPVPEVAARDHFVPPTVPDIAFHSDQHHHGHVHNNVRFSIRSPQPVQVGGRRFDGFMDLRLLRCAGDPFGEQDLLAAQQVSAFIARATELAAQLVTAGKELEVTAFDSGWHWESITGGRTAASGPSPDHARRAS
ncbi:hypothetical protein [Streptomyces sp. GC420]|uniref:hypothetical protein n=1 Tax=Streptomyces sp. GC420 TaxID=2697568 RepID=UPI001414CC54|nr:hypothetical protein [Streptomyces sp. GC420]NBM20939.1 hypothetical protein [Streptomyces sp. GC420]